MVTSSAIVALRGDSVITSALAAVPFSDSIGVVGIIGADQRAFASEFHGCGICNCAFVLEMGVGCLVMTESKGEMGRVE